MSRHRQGLPPFPLDEQTLAMLDLALDPWSHGEPDADSTHVGEFLAFVSELAGSDTKAVASDDLGVTVLRDQQYSEHDLISALIAEVRRLREAAGS